MLLVDNKVQNIPPGDSTIQKYLMTPLAEDSVLVEKIQQPPITNMDPSMDIEAK